MPPPRVIGNNVPADHVRTIDAVTARIMIRLLQLPIDVSISVAASVMLNVVVFSMDEARKIGNDVWLAELRLMHQQMLNSILVVVNADDPRRAMDELNGIEFGVKPH